MKLWTWQKGRQHGCDYLKFPLWYFRVWKFGFDAYVLKYEAHTTLSWHKDPVEDGKHYRLNIRVSGWDTFLWKDLINGEKKTNLFSSFIYFRPDITWHMVVTHSKVTKLSFGFVKFK